jgi:4-amino-4-deoxy-L-arabinose transferase-like glycosyltransferase
MARTDFRSLWMATLGDGRWIWLLLILPVALFLPALPIDETRYLGVAWEMRVHGDFLVPHLNGATYADKPPLLFWLINIAWTFLGLNVWSVRLGVLAASFATVVMFERLMRRLDADVDTSRRAAFILMGMVYFALFSSAIMFDVLLTTWVMLSLHGAIDLDRRRWLRGVVLLSIGFGLGILTKGPVILLDAALVIVFGPWWSETARESKGRWYGSLVLGILGGAAIGLAWAIPAAISGGPDYSNAIFFHQTLDRVTKSFAHRRPLWFYFAVVPFMVLPWTLVVRARWRAWRESFHISVRRVLFRQRQTAALSVAAARRTRRVSRHGARARRFARRRMAVRTDRRLGRHRPRRAAIHRRTCRRRRLFSGLHPSP